jgi:hypothetical protein
MAGRSVANERRKDQGNGAALGPAPGEADDGSRPPQSFSQGAGIVQGEPQLSAKA